MGLKMSPLKKLKNKKKSLPYKFLYEMKNLGSRLEIRW